MSQLTEKQYQELRRDVEEAKEEAQRAQGALDEGLSRLEKEFGCKTIQEAREKLEDMEEERNAAEKKFEKALKDYERKWKSTKSKER